MTEVSQEQPRKPGEKFGGLRKEYVPLRDRAEKILKESGITGEPLRNARTKVAKELVKRQRKSDIDWVTSLPVRRLFEERLGEEVERSQRFKHPLTMVLIDLNNLKKINDVGGYPEGDEVLKAIAKGLKASKREIDFVARYGGDEFALLLVETPLQNIEIWWKRFIGEIKDIPYTVSAGATEVNLGDIEETRKILSKAVFQAKEQGQRTKNCLIRHSPD